MAKMGKAYLAGPMRHFQDFNFPAFFSGELQLQEQGWEVFNPARHDIERGFNPTGMSGEEDVEGFSIRECMHDDLKWITTNAEAVFVLPDWDKSRGAIAEVATAFSIGIPVYTLDGTPVTELPGKTSIPNSIRAINPNPKDAIGTGKVPMELVSDIAIAEEALAMVEGASKYGIWNFRSIPVRSSTYIAACKRHLADWFNGIDRDPDTTVHHLGSARACLGILLDAAAMETLIDDRPPSNPRIQKILEEHSVRVKHLRNMFKECNPRHYSIADTK